MVRQWVSEIGRAARPNGAGSVRVPSELEIQLLTAMFPDIGRDVVLGVLQRRSVTTLAIGGVIIFDDAAFSPNLEAATETLLTGSR